MSRPFDPPVRKSSGSGIAGALFLAASVLVSPASTAHAQTPDQLVEMAREAARTDRNKDSAALFQRAIEANPALRNALLREYADQLTYSGRSAEAVPLFREVLAGNPSEEDRKRAERGLALALLWSGQFDDAAKAWQPIVDANPNDADARKNLREALVKAARAAATRNDNGQAADLFARAIGLDKDRRMELLLDYAAQLTYSGRAHEAQPLYDEALASGKLPAAGEAEARRGRALALLWSGQTDQSVAAWQRILDANPNDADARKNLREALVGAARSAASRNENALSAALFARAIGLDKARRVELLREYAAQLAYSGRARQAVPLFDEALASGKLSKDDAAQARRGRALALLWSGRYPEAIHAWRAFLRADPNDLDARKNVTEALIGAARQAASEDRNAESAGLFARAIALSPSRRLELLVEYANQLTYSAKAAKAVPLYREALDGRTLNHEERRAALLGLALALDWSDENAHSLDVYDQVLLLYPDSVQALMGRGNVLTQLDRNKEALESFERAILLSPGSTEPVRNAGRSLSYLGRQRLALERLAPLLAGSPDRETLVIAAQAELWKGRPDKTLVLADQVLAVNPDDEQAQAIAAQIAMMQRPLTDVKAAISTQNDGLVISGVTLRQSIGMDDGMRTVGLQARTIDMRPDTGDSVRISSAGLFGRNRFNDMFELNGSFFLNRVTSDDFTHVEPTYDAWLTMWPNDVLRFDFSVGRSYFDDVQSVSDNILIDTVGASMDVLPDPDTRLTGRGNYGFISDGNRRVFAQAEAERRLLRRPNVFAGARSTYMSFSEPDLDNGYFNTPWLYNVEGTLRLEAQPVMGWNVWASGSAGYEWQPDAAKPIWSAAVATAYTVSDQFRLDAELRHQDSADTGGSDAFRRTTLSGGFEYRW